MFSPQGESLREWGESGEGPGQLSAPIDLVIDEDGFVYVSDSGTGRVQKFTADDHSPTDTGSKSQHTDVLRASTGAQPELAVGRGVCIVGHGHRPAGEIGDAIAQGHMLPAGQVC
ncbi:MAG: hypothetical protein IIA33_02530 [Planctomycetes bacterium]|nr:hypothetical protein [Planctomycetota bacterium]